MQRSLANPLSSETPATVSFLLFPPTSIHETIVKRFLQIPAEAGLFAFVLLAGCGGGDSGGPSAPVVSLTVVNDILRPGEVVVVAGTALDAFPELVAAQVGGTSFDLFKVNDSTLAGLVPATGAGNVALTFALADTSASLPVTVLAPRTFADPAAAIGAVLNAQVASFPETAPEGEDSAAWAAESAFLDSLRAEAIAANGDLSPAELLALARLLAPFGADTAAPATAPSLLGEPACTQAQGDALQAVYHGSLAVSTSIASAIAGFFSERLRKTLDLASTNALRQTRIAMLGRNARCKVPKSIRYTTTGVRGVAGPAGAPGQVASAVGPDRFFKGYRMRYTLGGDLRTVSQQELAKDPLLATVDGAYRKVRGMALGNMARFPAWAQPIINSLPPSVAETPPGPLTADAMAPAQVRIERVSPASVSLTTGTQGDEITLTSGNTVTSDVPFTYDLVAVADPTVRKSMSGVLRPFMSATFGPSGQVFQGERSLVNIGGVVYGELRCGGSRPLHVTGGDKGVWQAFEWTISSAKTPADSVSEPLTASEFEAGDHSFQGSWYMRWRENDIPVYIPFTVGLRVSYIDQVTDSLKYSSEFWFTCQ